MNKYFVTAAVAAATAIYLFAFTPDDPCSGKYPCIVKGVEIFTHYRSHTPMKGNPATNPKAQRLVDLFNPNRVVTISNRYKAYDIPASGNAFFACSDINMVRDSSFGSEDSFVAQSVNPTGFVVIDGQKFSCAEEDKHTIKTKLGDIEAGGSTTFTVPIR